MTKGSEGESSPSAIGTCVGGFNSVAPFCFCEEAYGGWWPGVVRAEWCHSRITQGGSPTRGGGGGDGE